MAIEALFISKAPNMRFHRRDGDDERHRKISSPRAVLIPASIRTSISAVIRAISAAMHSTWSSVCIRPDHRLHRI